ARTPPPCTRTSSATCARAGGCPPTATCSCSTGASPASDGLRLFVTGLGGYLGHAIAAVVRNGHELSGTVRTTPAPPGARSFALDVRDEGAVGDALDQVRPDAVIHTAYVQGGEEERSVNVDGAAAVARAAAARGVRLVHLSSDVIFTGDLGRAIREDDPAAPMTAYGATKAEAETV